MDQSSVPEEIACSNCLSTEAKQGNFRSQFKIGSDSEAITVRVHQAVIIIYALDSYHLEHEDYYLCEDCIDILARLYPLYTHFKNLCRPDSRIDIARARRRSAGDAVVRDVDLDVKGKINTLESIPPSPSPSFAINSEEDYVEEGDSYFAPTPTFPLTFSTEDEANQRLRLQRRSLRRKLCRSRTSKRVIARPAVNLATHEEESSQFDIANEDRDIKDVDEEWRPRAPTSGGHEPMRRGRGRPRKLKIFEATTMLKRKRGRPRKSGLHSPGDVTQVKRKPGRPRKIPSKVDEQEKIKKSNGDEGNANKEVGFGLEKRRLGRPRGSKNHNFGYKILGDKKVYTCPQCGKEANTASNLLAHIRCVHERVREFSCPMCPKRFAGRDGLCNHVRVHHMDDKNSVKKYACEVAGCGKSFTYNAGLYAHSFTHNEEAKRFMCPHCDRKFKANTELKVHITVHSEERNYTCEQCGGTFKTVTNLRKHHRFIHPESYEGALTTNLTCHVCHKKFNVPGNLRQHVRTVHDQLKPYRCRLCGKSFSHRSNLKVHLRGFHSQQEAQIKLLVTSSLLDRQQGMEALRTTANGAEATEIDTSVPVSSTMPRNTEILKT